MGIIGFIVLIWVSDYRRDRILAWWDPWGHSLTKSFQSVQSLVAIGSGGIFGQGLGEGTAKYFYLPEAHTDFAFAGYRCTIAICFLWWFLVIDEHFCGVYFA